MRRWIAVTAMALLAGKAAAAPTGETIFQGACAACHAAGSPRVLSGQKLLPRTGAITGADPSEAIRLILDGHQPAPERRGAWMPGFAPVLSDPQIADVLNWLRQAASAPAWPDLAARVQAVRVASAQAVRR